MGIIEKFFAPSPFKKLHAHSIKVHDCVKLLRPLTNALLAEEYDKIEQLHNEMSRMEHEADILKNELRDEISKLHFLSVGKHELSEFLSYLDDVADEAEDFAVILTLRNTKLPAVLQEHFLAFVEQIIKVSEMLLLLAEKLSTLADAAFGGKEAEEMLETIEKIGEEEWKADRMERKFARTFYGMEDEMDPVTVMFLDKYCLALSKIANAAEKTAKYLRLVIRKK
jgi:predicted phosphate transport protein (TIGR00153 family)